MNSKFLLKKSISVVYNTSFYYDGEYSYYPQECTYKVSNLLLLNKMLFFTTYYFNNVFTFTDNYCY